VFRHILIATDGTALARRAAAFAVKLAASTGARLTAFHAIPAYLPIPYVDAFIAEPELLSSERYAKEAERATRRMLEAIAKRAQASKVRCEIAWAFDNAPWKAILEEARKRRCDLIVMSSHGRRGIEAMILGSEATKVLTHSKVPVVITR
jgi:nucleotide-binding universal stress UspA family protein